MRENKSRVVADFYTRFLTFTTLAFGRETLTSGTRIILFNCLRYASAIQSDKYGRSEITRAAEKRSEARRDEARRGEVNRSREANRAGVRALKWAEYNNVRNGTVLTVARYARYPSPLPMSILILRCTVYTHKYIRISLFFVLDFSHKATLMESLITFAHVLSPFVA